MVKFSHSISYQLDMEEKFQLNRRFSPRLAEAVPSISALYPEPVHLSRPRSPAYLARPPILRVLALALADNLLN